MAKYMKRPVVIEAIKYTGDNIQKVWDLFGAADIYGPVEHDCNVYIRTLEGDMRCSVDDYIIRGIKGELYPCKAEIFEDSYYEVPDHLEVGSNGS